MANVDDIVRGLTKAQRRSIEGAQDMLSDHGGYPFYTVRITCNPWPEGVAQFLTLNTDRLTPLGLEVRARLLSSSGATDHAQ